ncbi:MAG TPA: helix-turn-helix transcriptional regulator [Polyangiales bacterium]
MTPSPDLTTKSRVAAVLSTRLRLGKVQMAGVAKALDMSEATLRRRLSAEGTSFSALIEEVRFELARRYLRDPTLEVGDVAVLLGFRDRAEFEATFSVWSNGVSPEDFRAS